MGGGESAGTVRDELVFSVTKKRASDLLEQARRQHAAAAENLRAERELYQRLGEQLTALADPASLDLEIAAIASRAGASVAQAEEDAARARRAQLAAERERDDAIRLRAHADDAAEQLAADAEEAELALAERTAEFDLDRATFVARARQAEEFADRSRVAVAEARAAGEEAETRAAAETASAQARADDAIERARRAAEDAIADARREAAEQVAAAQARADTAADQARRDGEAVRRETAAAVADASAATDRARAEAATARDVAADAQANAATAGARADAATAEAERARDEISRLRDELGRLAAAREAEVARLAAAHQAALEAERGRAVRAENELDVLRRSSRGPLRLPSMAAERAAHALYQKVAEDIKAAIASGEYPAAAKLPSENELAQRYGVSRGTIRQAFAALRADGVIASRRGARRVVFGGPRVQSFGELLSFSRWARAAGEVPGGEVISLDRRPATALEVARLAIGDGAAVYALIRVRLLSGRPVMIERAVYPDKVGVLVAGLDLTRDSITERLEELGVVFTDAEHVIDAVAASAEDARWLRVRAGVPLLRERRFTTDRAGQPVEWSDDRYLSTETAFSVRNSITVNALSRTPPPAQ
jgi:GntR family transcriptional regulator